jgi:hypothetical protein
MNEVPAAGLLLYQNAGGGWKAIHAQGGKAKPFTADLRG